MRALYALSTPEVLQLCSRGFAPATHWTEALAVGSREFVSLAESMRRNQRRFERTTVDSDSGMTTWSLREPSGAYGAHFEAK